MSCKAELQSVVKVRALRAGFWEQLKATIKRNVVRKMRNKRHTIKVRMMTLSMSMTTMMIKRNVMRKKRHTVSLRVGLQRQQDES